MIDSLRKTILSGLGAASLSRERLRTLLEQMVQRGDLKEEQARKLQEEILSQGRSESRAVAEALARSVLRLLERSPLVTRREFDRLKRRVRALETGLGARVPDEVEPADERGGDPLQGER